MTAPQPGDISPGWTLLVILMTVVITVGGLTVSGDTPPPPPPTPTQTVDAP